MMLMTMFVMTAMTAMVMLMEGKVVGHHSGER